MTIDAHQSLIPVGCRTLNNLAHVLRRGQAWARERDIDEAVILQTRLVPDMFPLVRQVQIATDMVTRGASRLAGQEPQGQPDDETAFDALLARIDRAVAMLQEYDASAFDGCEQRTIVLPLRSGELTFSGQDYLLHFVLPNLFFHCTTAYNLLRQMGVPIGKADFLGGV